MMDYNIKDIDSVKKLMLEQVEPFLAIYKREDAKKCRARIIYRLLEGGTYKEMGYDLGITACRVCQIRDMFFRFLPMELKLLFRFLIEYQKRPRCD